MKTLFTYMLLLSTLAVAATSCDDEPVYAVPENAADITISIKTTATPKLLDDGSLVAFTPHNGDSKPPYDIIRISKDGTVTSTTIDPGYEITADIAEGVISSIQLADGNIVMGYCSAQYGCYIIYVISKAGDLIYSNVVNNIEDYMSPQAWTPLPDGGFALILGENNTSLGYYWTETNLGITTFDSKGNIKKEITIPSPSNEPIKIDCARLVGENIMLFCRTYYGLYQPKIKTFVLSPEDGASLGSNELYLDYNNSVLCRSFGDHVYISEQKLDTHETKVTQLDALGNKVFSTILDMYPLHNISEIDGKAIFAGIKPLKDCEYFYTFPAGVDLFMRPYIKSIKARIITMDAANGRNPETIDLSYDGGMMLYGVASDGSDGYHVYLSRILPSEVNDVEYLFHDNIHIYHTKDLHKLQIEQ